MYRPPFCCMILLYLNKKKLKQLACNSASYHHTGIAAHVVVIYFKVNEIVYSKYQNEGKEAAGIYIYIFLLEITAIKYRQPELLLYT